MLCQLRGVPASTGQQHPPSAHGTLYISCETWKGSATEITCTISYTPEYPSWAPVHLHHQELWNKATGGCRDSFTRPRLPNWKQKHIFLSSWHLMRLTAFWSTKHVCREIQGLSYDLCVFHNRLGGEKNASALGTSGVLFLTKMWCLFCFLLTTEKSLSFQATGGLILFQYPCRLYMKSLQR